MCVCVETETESIRSAEVSLCLLGCGCSSEKIELNIKPLVDVVMHSIILRTDL